MGKYLIQMKSLDGDAEFDKTFADGVVCDGFAILAHEEENGGTCAIHGMSIDGISKVISGNFQIMAAAILAKARRDADSVCAEGERKNMLRELLGMS